jgi:hypothetical protein
VSFHCPRATGQARQHSARRRRVSGDYVPKRELGGRQISAHISRLVAGKQRLVEHGPGLALVDRTLAHHDVDRIADEGVASRACGPS